MSTINDIEVLTSAEDLLDPRRTAVVVIDMQNETASPEGGYATHGLDIARIRRIVPTIQAVLAGARRAGMFVAYTEFIHRDRRGTSLMDGPNTFLHARDSWVSDVMDGTWEARTLDELEPLPGDLVVQKSRASAIYNTYLANELQRRDIRSAVLMGCLTDGCILKTAVDLTQAGYYPVVVTDAVESLTPEAHALGLQYITLKFPAFTADQVLAVWDGEPGPARGSR